MGLLWPKCKIQQLALLNLIHLASINSSCSDPSLEPFCPPADQHSHATWCHLQTDWGCIWSPNPDNWYKYLTGLGPVLSPGENPLWPAANWIIKNSIHQSLGLAIQTFFYPEKSIPLQAMNSQLSERYWKAIFKQNPDKLSGELLWFEGTMRPFTRLRHIISKLLFTSKGYKLP